MSIRKRLRASIALGLLMLLASILIGGNACSQAKLAPKLKVVTTIYPIYDITKNLAGDNLEVVCIILPGESPHTFEITPERVKQLQGAKLAFKVGLGLDDWLDDTIGSLGLGIQVHNLHQGIDLIEDKGAANPHIWLSLVNAQTIVENISERLTGSFPQFKDEFEQNQQIYMENLQEMDAGFKDEAANFSQSQFIAFHDAWSYMARDLGLEQVMSVEPFPGKEPAPQYIIELYETIQQYQLDTIFIEPQLSTDVVKYLSEDLGLEVKVLDPLGGTGGRDSYLELMDYNFQQLKYALK